MQANLRHMLDMFQTYLRQFKSEANIRQISCIFQANFSYIIGFCQENLRYIASISQAYQPYLMQMSGYFKQISGSPYIFLSLTLCIYAYISTSYLFKMLDRESSVILAACELPKIGILTGMPNLSNFFLP